MRFYSPDFFYLLFVIPALVLIYLYSLVRRKNLKARLGDSKLINDMCSSLNYRARNIKFALIILSILFIIIALSRPQYGKKLEEVKRRGLDIMLTVDVSKSMLAEDIRPSRLVYARNEITSFLDKLRGDRVGITSFSGNAYVQCPLTLDYSAVKLFLDLLDPSSVTTPGTNIEIAIMKAKGALMIKEGESKYRVIVLITDGEILEGNAIKAAQECKKAGIKIFTVGIGTPMGEPIPLRDDANNITGYLKTPEGEVVMSRLDEGTLSTIAAITQGNYTRLSLEKVQKAISRMEKQEFKEKYKTSYEDRFQYPLGLAILCLFVQYIIPERRGKLKSIINAKLAISNLKLRGRGRKV